MSRKLSEQQLLAVETLAMGGRIQDAATVANVDSRTISRWKNNPLFKDELQRQIDENKKNIDERIVKFADTLIMNIFNLANSAASEKVRLDANIYLLNRVAGTPVSKLEKKETKETIVKNEPTWEDLKKTSIEGNVISISDEIS